MTYTYSMSPYSLRFLSSGSPVIYKNVGPNGAHKLMQDYLDARKVKVGVLPAKESAVSVDDYTPYSGGIILRFKGGKFGYSSEIENLKSGKVFNRTKEDCEYLPFNAVFEYRDHEDEGILVMQRFGPFGMKTSLEIDMNTYISNIGLPYTVKINQLVTNELLKKILGGGIKKIRYLRYTVDGDLCDALDLPSNYQKEATMETVIKATRDGFLDIPKWMKDVISGKKEISEYIEVNKIEYEDVKLQIEYEGKAKTLDLAELQKLRMSVAIKDDLKIGSDGHPTKESFAAVALPLIADIKASLNWKSHA